MFIKGNSLLNDIVNVYYINTNNISDTVHFTEILDEEEYKRYSKYSVGEAKKEFLLGRYLLKTVLGNYLEIHPGKIILKKNKYGKLYLDKNCHQINLKFNLSHSGGIVVGAFVLENDIGIDIEKVDKDISNIVRRFFSPEEKEYISIISNNNPYPKRLLSYQIWTLREAYIKAKGFGLNIPLSSFSVFDDLGMFFYTRRIFSDYYLSIAVNNPEDRQYTINFYELSVKAKNSSKDERTEVE